MHLKTFAAVVISALIGASALAANETFHVAPGGNDTNTGCVGVAYNVSCAKLTVQSAVNAYSGTGNTILLHAGTITASSCTPSPTEGSAAVNITSSKSGAAGAYNVIKAANDGAVSVSSGGCNYQVFVSGSYIQLGGLGTGEGFTLLGNATLASCIDGFPANGVVSFSHGATDGRVYGVNFLANTAYAGPAGDVGCGQLVAIGSGATNHHFANNTMRMGNLNGGIKVNAPGNIGTHDCDNFASDWITNVTIENNVFLHDNSDVTNGNTTRKFMVGGEKWKDIVIRNNYWRYGTAASSVPGDHGALTMRSACRLLDQNNYVEYYGATGGNGIFYSFTGGTGDTITNNRNKFYNNTIYGGNGAAIAMYIAGSENEAMNNLIYSTSVGGIGTAIRTPNPTCTSNRVTLGYNSTFNFNTPFSTCPSDTLLGNNVTANPLLNLSGNKPTPFFQLQAGTGTCPNATCPLINAGCPNATCPNNPTTDYDGQTRSSPPDIGADEQSASLCGNGVIDGGEVCDGTNFGGDTCSAHPPCTGGSLLCVSCTSISTTNCTGCAGGDVIAPSPITTLAVSAPTKAPQLGAVLTWTATGDDNATGTATTYTLRGKGAAVGAAAPTITSCSDGAALTAVLNSSGTPLTSLPSPLTSGQAESWTVKALRPNHQYAFALCASDEIPNQSTLSNVVNITTAKYQGYGYQATGGGFTGSVAPTVCMVTNASDSGAGSLRNCLAPNTFVMFGASGTLLIPAGVCSGGTNPGTSCPVGTECTGGGVCAFDRLDFRTAATSNFTVDGSTAPSPGFTIDSNVNVDDMLRIGDVSHFIMTYLRVGTSFSHTTSPAETQDAISLNSNTSVGVQHFVLDHMTMRDVGDSVCDLYDDVQDATISYNYFMHDHYTYTTRADAVTFKARVTIHHNLYAENGERQPQLLFNNTDMELRNNVHYNWSYNPAGYAGPVGSYGIRIRDNNNDNINANIISNVFVANPTGVAPVVNSGIVYGASAGCDAEEGTCAGCTPQAAGGASSLCNGTGMGELYVAGNSFSHSTADTYSTVAAERTVPTNAQITTDSSTELCNTVLDVVGAHYPVADETALIATVDAAMGCSAPTVPDTGRLQGVNPSGVTKR